MASNSNNSFMSPWYKCPDDLDALLLALEEGDLLEIDKRYLKHWAVYVGIMSGNPTVVHRTNHGGISGLTSSSPGIRPNSKDVCSDKLEDVVGKRKVRINNSHDRRSRPKSKKQIVRDAWAAVEESKGDYCLFTNNCEQFAKSIRNGTATSQQVRNGIRNVGVGLGLALGAAAAIASFRSDQEGDYSYNEEEEEEEEEAEEKKRHDKRVMRT